MTRPNDPKPVVTALDENAQLRDRETIDSWKRWRRELAWVLGLRYIERGVTLAKVRQLVTALKEVKEKT